MHLTGGTQHKPMNSFYRKILPLLLLYCLLLISCENKNDASSTLPGDESTAPTLTPAPPSPKLAPAPVQRPYASQPALETVKQLIARAEAEYARGQANYAAGHME